MRGRMGMFLALLLLACESFVAPTGPRPLALSDCGVALGDSFPVPLLDRGGLYGGGSNAPPTFHVQAGMSSGALVPASGAVLAVIGMSNTRLQAAAWRDVAVTDAQVVNAACSGCTVFAWEFPARPAWEKAALALARAGVQPADVDVVWMNHARSQVDPPTADDLDRILASIMATWPNVRQVFVTSRMYGGYRNLGDGEPAAWQAGPAVRQFVLRHVGETDPFVDWGPYWWANGVEPRSDGLQWLQEDFKLDGVHPSGLGAAKTGAMLEEFFGGSPSTEWYR